MAIKPQYYEDMNNDTTIDDLNLDPQNLTPDQIAKISKLQDIEAQRGIRGGLSRGELAKASEIASQLPSSTDLNMTVYENRNIRAAGGRGYAGVKSGRGQRQEVANPDFERLESLVVPREELSGGGEGNIGPDDPAGPSYDTPETDAMVSGIGKNIGKNAATVAAVAATLGVSPTVALQAMTMGLVNPVSLGIVGTQLGIASFNDYMSSRDQGVPDDPNVSTPADPIGFNRDYSKVGFLDNFSAFKDKVLNSWSQPMEFFDEPPSQSEMDSPTGTESYGIETGISMQGPGYNYSGFQGLAAADKNPTKNNEMGWMDAPVGAPSLDQLSMNMGPGSEDDPTPEDPIGYDIDTSDTGSAPDTGGFSGAPDATDSMGGAGEFGGPEGSDSGGAGPGGGAGSGAEGGAGGGAGGSDADSEDSGGGGW
jgi:hypothetical protein